MATQTQLEMRSNTEGTFRNAIVMSETGASAEELIKRCGLAAGEAELMVHMHRQASAHNSA